MLSFQNSYLAFNTPGNFPIPRPSGIPNVPADQIIQRIITNGINLLLIVILLLSFLFLVMGGVRWSMSSGDKNAVASARDQVTWSIIGLILALSSFLILRTAGILVGVNLLNP